MKNPVLYLARVYNRRIEDVADLNDTIDLLRRVFSNLYERKLFAAVTAAAGFIEVPPSSDKTRWNVHLHVALDVGPDGLDVTAANAAWQQSLNNGHDRQVAQHEAATSEGAFTIDGPVRNREALANYISKRDSWSPQPGTLEPRLLQVLFSALHGVEVDPVVQTDEVHVARAVFLQR